MPSTMAAHVLSVFREDVETGKGKWVQMAVGTDLGRTARLIRATFDMDQVKIDEGGKTLYKGLGYAIPWESTPCLLARARPSLYTINELPPEPPPKTQQTPPSVPPPCSETPVGVFPCPSTSTPVRY